MGQCISCHWAPGLVPCPHPASAGVLSTVLYAFQVLPLEISMPDSHQSHHSLELRCKPLSCIGCQDGQLQHLLHVSGHPLAVGYPAPLVNVVPFWQPLCYTCCSPPWVVWLLMSKFSFKCHEPSPVGIFRAPAPWIFFPSPTFLAAFLCLALCGAG